MILSVHHSGIYVPYPTDGHLPPRIQALDHFLSDLELPLGNRLLVTNYTNIDGQDDFLKSWALGDRLETSRSNPSRQYKGQGVVLAAWPTWQALELAVLRAQGGVLIGLEHQPDFIEGWAAATGAIDVTTGEVHPGVSDPEKQALEMLAMHETEIRGPRTGRNSGLVREYLADLEAAGRDLPFVTSYLIAGGADADLGKALGKHWPSK